MRQQACNIRAQCQFGIRAMKSNYCKRYNINDFSEVFGHLFHIRGTYHSGTEVRMNIEDLVSPGRRQQNLTTDGTQDTSMAATSGVNSSGPLAEVKLLFSAILTQTKRLDKLEKSPSSSGKGKSKGKRSSQEPQSKVPAKKSAKGCSRSMSKQSP